MRLFLKHNPELMRQRQAEQIQEWHRKMRSAGRCYDCGRDAGGRFRCERHREALNARRRNKRKAAAAEDQMSPERGEIVRQAYA